MSASSARAQTPAGVAAPARESTIVIEEGLVRVEVELAPVRVSIWRAGRALLLGGAAWLAEGSAHDRFIQVTEGVVPDERLQPREWLDQVVDVRLETNAVELDARFTDGRPGRLQVSVGGGEQATVLLIAEGDPLRIGVSFAPRLGEHFAGLGARHAHTIDHAGASIRLGADRRYLGPVVPAALRDVGGLPQGDYAPVPWMQSSAGWAAWLQTNGDGALFELARDGIEISQRSAAGPLSLAIFCQPTAAARLRRFLELTGKPALLPEWAYGHWKSRDFYNHADDAMEDFHGYRWHGIPLDAIVLDSPWETQYNTWEFNPHQFPDPTGLISRLRGAGVRTVVWITPWVNIDSVDGQYPPDPASEQLHAAPASNYEEGARAGHYVRGPDDKPFVARWWMGVGSPVDLTSPEAEEWWREQAKRALALGIEGIKADDGEGYYFPANVRFADGRSGAEAAWDYGRLYRQSMQRALDEVHHSEGALFGRCGWTSQQSIGLLWGGDQMSDFWSLRALVAATLSAAASGFSNFSHDIGGYLGEGAIRRCPAELLIRWAQFGCFTPLMQAHARKAQEPWTYDSRTLELIRAAVLLHERLVPYVRAAAATAARTGLPIIRPQWMLERHDLGGFAVPDAYGYGPALWVAPVLDDGARERSVRLPGGKWIDYFTGERSSGGAEITTAAPLAHIPVWVREGSIVVTYPTEHVLEGLGDVPEEERPLEATLWGRPPLGRTAVRLADGTKIAWRNGRWSASVRREIRFVER